MNTHSVNHRSAQDIFYSNIGISPKYLIPNIEPLNLSQLLGVLHDSRPQGHHMMEDRAKEIDSSSSHVHRRVCACARN